MEDLGRIWDYFVAALHIAFAFTDYFATRAPLQLGYVLLVMAGLVRLYQKRRWFYAGLNVAADWDPTYGSIVSGRMTEMLLSTIFWVIVILGVATLGRHYFPVLYDDIIGSLVALTGASLVPATKL